MSSDSVEWLADDLKLQVMTSQWKQAVQRVTIMQQAFLATRLELAELRAENQRLQQSLKSDELLLSSGISVIATLLWKASDCPKVIKLLLKSKSKLNSFFLFFHRKLKKYKDLREFYQASSEATDLILSLGGFLVNLFAFREACNVTLCYENGRQLLLKIFQLLGQIDETPPESQSQKHVKAIFLMILYNMSLELKGYQLIKDKGCLFRALSRDLLQGDDHEVRLLEVRILHSLMCQDDVHLFNTVKNQLTSEELNRMLEEMDDGRDSEATLIMKCLMQCLNDYNEMSDIVGVLEETQEECMVEDTLDEDVDDYMGEDCIADLLAEIKSSPEEEGSSECCSLCFDVVHV